MSVKLKLIIEKLYLLALPYVAKGQFRKNHSAAYARAFKLGILGQICSHMPERVRHKGEHNINFKWSLEKIKLEANKYIKRGDFAKGNSRAYDAAWKRDDFDKICSHMDAPTNKPYTDQKLKEIALTFLTRGQFCRSNASAYSVARRRGLLDKICSHMPPASNDPYSVEELQIEANNYTSRNDFAKNSSGAYSAALNLKVLDQICSKMKPSTRSSKAEKELLAEIRKLYPNAKTIRDSSVRIPNKPHIHGFEIDIFVNGRGIEYDGSYHHSFDGLKSHRQHWPDCDIYDYHGLKDNWFLSKGIQILHIKEEDWKKDKQACIKKCFDFLQLTD